MKVVTGGLGFIGSNFVKSLSSFNPDEVILIIDRISSRPKYLNLPSLPNVRLLDPSDIALLEDILLESHCSCIYHFGAESSTTCSDGSYLYNNNYKFSVSLIDLALKHQIPIVNASSASVYGTSRTFDVDPINESPINHYAFSKLLVDQYIRQLLPSASSQILSFRFFNVYGFGEFAKEGMASLPYQFFRHLHAGRHLSIFGESHGCQPGEQSRDFVYIDDLISIIGQALTRNISGIFNLGSGISRSFNDLALVSLNSYNRVTTGSQSLPLQHYLDNQSLKYIDFPDHLRQKYQPYTCANMNDLQSCGILPPCTSLEEGINLYYTQLWQNIASL